MSCTALLQMRSFATAKPGRLKKKKASHGVIVSCNFWLHHDGSPVSFANQNFATDKPDTSHGMQGTTPQWNGHGRQRAQAVLKRLRSAKANPTAQMAATNPTPRARSHNTGNVPFPPITAGQRPPQGGLSGSRKWSEGPWPSASKRYKHHPCLA